MLAVTVHGDKVMVRQDLLDGFQVAVTRAYDIQAATEFPRVMEDEAPLDVTVCLGTGRCLFSTQGSSKRHCPFCRTFPPGFDARNNVTELVRQHVQGN